MAKVHRSYELRRILAIGVVGVFWIAACAIPLWGLEAVIQPLAGKTTKVDANVVISLTLTVSIVVNVGLYLKSRSQAAELRRQRRTITELEAKDAS